MTKLVWAPEQKKYEFGVDRGVFYPSDNDPGVVWNGLISVQESFIGGEINSYHRDGTKYLDVVSPKNYQATVSAFSAPEAFSAVIGEKAVIPGFILTRQPRTRFDFSYRTMLGDEVGYKVHLVYNATASLSQRTYVTRADTSTAQVFTWKIDATPLTSKEYRPSAHYILDSTVMPSDLLATIENYLYGTTNNEPMLPTIDALIDMISLWTPYTIIENQTTGLAQLLDGAMDLYKTRVDGINRALPTTRLQPTPVLGLYRME